ncbi:hypothetical protein EWU23_07340 [Cytophagaceae bacterium 50C-KIRBA]|uniref:Lipoprotein n=1 Tax=Aquirufa beregesia TaxID=2516556 RepID=A0ABX0EYA9_9BACT|nr:hypothetical protein [Aquirufa beregesia]NGZ44286.1 hypothetical protein [Aquirufa beregesia]
MKYILKHSIAVTILATIITSCGNDSNKNNIVSIETNSEIQTNKGSNIFENPNELINALSQNGIGELKEWRNPMDMGWGSLTDYYQFGPQKDGYGMQNNIAYYIEGTENKATKIYINLNINNPVDKKNALKFLNDISKKTFRTLNISMPKELSKAILNSKEFNTELEGYKVSNELEKSKIETWKVYVVKK